MLLFICFNKGVLADVCPDNTEEKLLGRISSASNIFLNELILIPEGETFTCSTQAQIDFFTF